MAAAGAGTVLCSLDGLQEAGHAQLQQLQVSGLQRLMKSLAAELMGLLLQVWRALVLLSLHARAAHVGGVWRHARQACCADCCCPALLLLPQIGEQDQSSGGRLQQPGAASPALARLHTLTRDVNRAFRTFAVTNRIGMAALKSLNMDTGVLGLPPPPGHWAPVARLLAARCVGSRVGMRWQCKQLQAAAGAAVGVQAVAAMTAAGQHSFSSAAAAAAVRRRLPLQVLSDVCVAKRLFEESRAELLQQRHQLLAQLQAQLADNEASGTDYTTDATLTRLDGAAAAGRCFWCAAAARVTCPDSALGACCCCCGCGCVCLPCR